MRLINILDRYFSIFVLLLSIRKLLSVFQGEVAIESLLADGEEYVVTLEDGTEGETVLLEQDGNEQTIEVIVPDAHVECEIANAS